VGQTQGENWGGGAELSCLVRSLGQIAILVDELLKEKVRVISLKENIALN
jgi:hypothetical protein